MFQGVGLRVDCAGTITRFFVIATTPPAVSRRPPVICQLFERCAAHVAEPFQSGSDLAMQRPQLRRDELVVDRVARQCVAELKRTPLPVHDFEHLQGARSSQRRTNLRGRAADDRRQYVNVESAADRRGVHQKQAVMRAQRAQPLVQHSAELLGARGERKAHSVFPGQAGPNDSRLPRPAGRRHGENTYHAHERRRAGTTVRGIVWP